MKFLLAATISTLVLISVYCRPRSINTINKSQSNSPAIDAEKLLPPDHVDAVKFEKDGHINKDFHKEVFLGNHEEIDDEPIQIAEAKLVDIFHRYTPVFNFNEREYDVVLRPVQC